MINVLAIGPSLFAVIWLDSGNKWFALPDDVSLLELLVLGTALSAIDPVSVSMHA